jgi:hypothetical protein
VQPDLIGMGDGLALKAVWAEDVEIRVRVEGRCWAGDEPRRSEHPEMLQQGDTCILLDELRRTQHIDDEPAE